MKEVVLRTGAGQIGMAIAQDRSRRKCKGAFITGADFLIDGGLAAVGGWTRKATI